MEVTKVSFDFGIDFHDEDDEIKAWYFSRPFGKNSIGEFMSKAREILGNNSEGKISNHSYNHNYKTTVTNLLNNNVNPLHIQQITGHKKLESLNQYNTAPMHVQKQMSHTLSNVASPRPISNETLLLSIQQHHSKDWNPIGPLFHGAQISNCTFNINIQNPVPNEIFQPQK